MATRNEMVTWLKKNHPEMCEYQKIDSLATDSSEITDCGVWRSQLREVQMLYPTNSERLLERSFIVAKRH